MLAVVIQCANCVWVVFLVKTKGGFTRPISSAVMVSAVDF